MPDPPAPNPPPCTRSAPGWLVTVLMAAAGTLFIAFFVHWYEVDVFPDWGASIRQVIVNSIAPFVLFMVFMLVVPWNAAMSRLAPVLRLDRFQLTLIVSVWLLASGIGFVYLTSPILHVAGELNNPANASAQVRSSGVLDSVPPNLFLPPDAATQYHYGKSETTDHIPLSEVPWSDWARPLSYWIPFIFLVFIMSISLVRMVYRQWAKHELLTFPLADVADSLLDTEPKRAWPTIFRDQVFWIGFGLVFFIGLVNGLQKWEPKMIEIPLRFSHTSLVKEFPFLSNYCGTEAYSLFRGMLYPAIVAIAVLLPAEVSLTAWGGWVLMILGTGVWYKLTGDPIGRSETQYVNFGSMVALFGMIVYIGRREWGTILKWACRRRPPPEPDLARAVWACRFFVTSSAGLWVLLLVAGFDWFLAAVLVACFSLILLLAARMTAEMGFPWLSNLSGLAGALPVKFLGVAALGPQGLALFAIIGSLLSFDMTNSVVAQETTLARLRERAGQVSGRLYNGFILIGLCLAILATVGFTLWSNYSFGAQRESRITDQLRGSVSSVAKETDRLRSQGVLDELKEASTFQRLARIEPPDGFWTFFLLGAVLVAGCAFMRLRYTWWPFHPLPLLFFGTWAMSRMCFSFLIGWLIKIALLKVGGGKVFTRLKPFFIGVIIGQVAIAGFWITFNAIWFVCKGGIDPGKAISFFI